jgi:hypothetical protein
MKVGGCCKLERLGRRPGFAADVVSAGLLDHRAQPHPHHLMVIDDRDARPLLCHDGELARIIASQSRQPLTPDGVDEPRGRVQAQTAGTMGIIAPPRRYASRGGARHAQSENASRSIEPG